MRREGYFPAEPLGPLVPTGRTGVYTIQDSNGQDGDDVTQEQYDRLCSLLERLLEQRGAGSEEEAEDAECNCGMEGGTHSKKCPCYGKAAEDGIGNVISAASELGEEIATGGQAQTED